MHVNCPHCQNPIEIVDEGLLDDLTCPSCGSSFNLTIAEGTRTYRPQAVETVSHFELRDILGSGAFGTVWKAWDTRLDRMVAVKMPRKGQLDAGEVEKFLREARTAAQLQHPNIVNVHEVGREGDTVYIVSDLVDGVTLTSWLTGQNPTPRQAAEMCEQIARALHHAHEHGVIHRDLKPSNIMIDRNGDSRIMDFGLAKREAGEITVTLDGQILGTPAYMSPEQARGEGHGVDRRADVYSLGVVLYELLTGEKPFRGNQEMLLHQVLTEEPTAPRKRKPGIPRDLETICLKAMSKSADRRYATAEEFADDLRRFVDGKPILARPVSLMERGWRWIRRNPYSSIAAASLMLSAVIATAAIVEATRDRTLRWPTVVTTDPPGATVRMIPLDEYGRERPDVVIVPGKVTPVTIDLEPGDYRIQVGVEGFGFHDVLRTVPGSPESDIQRANFKHLSWEYEDGVVRLPVITIVPLAESVDGMVEVPGGEFEMGEAGLQNGAVPPVTRIVGPFLVEPHEVTVSDWVAAGFRIPPDMPSAPDPNTPVTNVSWDEAVRYAERTGRRLPSEAEYEFAATWGGTRETPWGGLRADINNWQFGTVGVPTHDRTPSAPPIQGLYSGVAEWTRSAFIRDVQIDRSFPDSFLQSAVNQRAVRGGPISVTNRQPDIAECRMGPRQRFSLDRNVTDRDGLGIRCFRSVAYR